MLFYSTVTVREHILIHNGSRIRNWWITHQYLAIGQSILLFAWPDSASYDLFRVQFTFFSLYLGGVQLLQYWYQSRGLYAKIAMAGTDQLMAITSGTRTLDIPPISRRAGPATRARPRHWAIHIALRSAPAKAHVEPPSC